MITERAAAPGDDAESEIGPALRYNDGRLRAPRDRHVAALLAMTAKPAQRLTPLASLRGSLVPFVLSLTP